MITTFYSNTLFKSRLAETLLDFVCTLVLFLCIDLIMQYISCCDIKFGVVSSFLLAIIFSLFTYYSYTKIDTEKGQLKAWSFTYIIPLRINIDDIARVEVKDNKIIANVVLHTSTGKKFALKIDNPDEFSKCISAARA